MSRILHIDASGRTKSSVSRQLSLEVVQKISTPQSTVIYRDVSQNLPFVNDAMIETYFTPEADRNEAQQNSVKLSDVVVEEILNANVLVIGIPIYNFAMPAGFKAWSDLAARVGKTFKYTEKGPVGLLENKKAYVVIASGGTKIDSEIDFLTPWLRQFLGFIGISDIEIIEAGAINYDTDAVENAHSSISLLSS